MLLGLFTGIILIILMASPPPPAPVLRIRGSEDWRLRLSAQGVAGPGSEGVAAQRAVRGDAAGALGQDCCKREPPAGGDRLAEVGAGGRARLAASKPVRGRSKRERSHPTRSSCVGRPLTCPREPNLSGPSSLFHATCDEVRGAHVRETRVLLLVCDALLLV